VIQCHWIVKRDPNSNQVYIEDIFVISKNIVAVKRLTDDETNIWIGNMDKFITVKGSVTDITRQIVMEEDHYSVNQKIDVIKDLLKGVEALTKDNKYENVFREELQKVAKNLDEFRNSIMKRIDNEVNFVFHNNIEKMAEVSKIVAQNIADGISRKYTTPLMKLFGWRKKDDSKNEKS
jgi:uncharacterized protein YabN with tetrapyrrole methylase and pyrophosphatase domain